MKIVIAPDTFKESLSAPQVAEAIAGGVLSACAEAQVDLCPMADGGEGTVEAMVAATAGRFLSADVFDPLGRPIRARFGLLGGPTTARRGEGAEAGLDSRGRPASKNTNANNFPAGIVLQNPAQRLEILDGVPGDVKQYVL